MAVKQLGKKNAAFSPEKFNNPGGKYGSVYNWIWAVPLSKEKTDESLEKFAKLGITGIAIIPEPKAVLFYFLTYRRIYDKICI